MIFFSREARSTGARWHFVRTDCVCLAVLKSFPKNGSGKSGDKRITEDERDINSPSNPFQDNPSQYR
jgi:hypothetical protein